MRTNGVARCALALMLVLSAGIAVLSCAAPSARAEPRSAESGFASFLAELWPDAQAAGISRRTFDAAFAGVAIDPRVIAITRRQPEYGKPVGEYVNAIASASRIETGRRKAEQWSTTFAAVKEKYAVDPRILLGIWGIESSYGDAKQTFDVIRALATLAQTGDRRRYFRGELLNALRIIEQGAIGRGAMLGSYAGAMGQPQFMPTDFLEFAVSFDGGNRRDIWNSVPDVLASMGNYLHKQGWNPDLPWGFEVVVPAGFDYRKSRGTFAQWEKLGLRRADGAPMPAAGDGILYFPSGASGPAFLVTANFVVIKTYNNSDVYALAVSLLGDRIRGGAPVRAAWPRDDVQFSRDDRITLQKKLAALGYPVKDFAAHIDFDLRDAIRDVQVKLGMRPDGHPTAALLRRLDELKH